MTAVQVLLTAAFLLALYFPVMLYIRSDPSANSPTRASFTFSIVVAGVLLLAMLRAYGVGMPGWLRITAYAAIVTGLAIQDWTLTKTQNRRSARLAREREEISQ